MLKVFVNNELTDVYGEHSEYNLKSTNDRCWLCSGQLCWDNDFDATDLGYDSQGIVTQLHCMSCGASVEYVLTEEMRNDVV